MTQPDPGKDTRLVEVKGRQIVVRQLQEMQVILMAREARLVMKPDLDNGRRLAAVGRIFDILESVVVQDEDREYLMDLTVAGNLEVGDLTSFISAFKDDAPVKPQVRRGRPRKSV
jgi:hypothetical protein